MTICEESSGHDTGTDCACECGNGEKMQNNYNSISSYNIAPIAAAARTARLRKSGFAQMWIVFWLLLLIENFAVEVLNVTRVCNIILLVLCELSTKILYNIYHFVFLLSELLRILYFKGSSKLDIKLHMNNYLNQIHIKMIKLLNKLIKNFELGVPLFNAYNTFDKILMSQFLTFYRLLTTLLACIRFELQIVKWLDSVTHWKRHTITVYCSRFMIDRRFEQ